MGISATVLSLLRGLCEKKPKFWNEVKTTKWNRVKWNEVQWNEPKLNEMIFIKILRFHFLSWNEEVLFHEKKLNEKLRNGIKWNEKSGKEIQWSVFSVHSILCLPLAVRGNCGAEILWDLRDSLANSGHQNLTLKATTQFLEEDNFHSLLVLSNFRTTTVRQSILLQIPRVLKSWNKLAFKRKSC